MSHQEEKLNKRERYKENLRPYDYYPELQKLNFENLGEGDRFYLQDFGIFNIDFLEDEFTLRARILGGRIDTTQLFELSRIITEYDLEFIITARAGIQLHGLTSDNVLEVFHRVNDLGISTWQSFGDNVRNITTDVFDGCAESSEIEVFPIMEEMQQFILKNPRYVGMLPRRISIGITGNRININSFFANDLCFLLAKKENIVGFNLFMGGKNSEMAQNADIFLLPEEVIDFYKAFLEAFYKHGSRSSRAYTRLFYLIEKIGMQEWKKYIEVEFGKKLNDAGELLFQIGEFQTFQTLKDGTYSYCYETDFGRLDAKELDKIASCAKRESLHVRLGADQNIYFLHLKDKNIPIVSPKLSATVLACAGAGKCPYSFWSIKDECSIYLPLEIIHKHRILVGFSGCAKGCGRHRHSDIGLIGLKTNRYGASEGGVRIFIGAQYSTGADVGVQLFSMVPFESLHDVIKMIILLFEQSKYDTFETFAGHQFNSYSSSFFALWVLFNLHVSTIMPLPENVDTPTDLQTKIDLLKNTFNEAKEYEFTKNLEETVDIITKKYWTVKGEESIYIPPINRTVFR